MDTLKGDRKFYARLSGKALVHHNTREYAEHYRAHDEGGVREQWETHIDLGEFVCDVSASFTHPIDVLDLACGSGRYFHCLKNVKSLTGVDISQEMLMQAKHPVNGNLLNFPIRLICQNVVDIEFPAETFDMIYAIGIFGLWLPIDDYFFKKIAEMLKPGGRFAFSAFDKNSQLPSTWKRRVAQFVMPMLPTALKRLAMARMMAFEISEHDLRTVMTRSPFTNVSIKRRYLDSGIVEFLCVAHR